MEAEERVSLEIAIHMHSTAYELDAPDLLEPEPEASLSRTTTTSTKPTNRTYPRGSVLRFRLKFDPPRADDIFQYGVYCGRTLKQPSGSVVGVSLELHEIELVVDTRLLLSIDLVVT